MDVGRRTGFDRGLDGPWVDLVGKSDADNASGTFDPGRRGLDDRTTANHMQRDERIVDPAHEALGAEEPGVRFGERIGQPRGIAGRIDLKAEGSVVSSVIMH